jgi:hypothetical protein
VLLTVLIVAATAIVTRTFGKTPPASLPASDDHPASALSSRR